MNALLNYLTARPTLELLLALEGFESPTVTPAQALPLFTQFLALPRDPGAKEAGFQAEIVAEGKEEGLLSIVLAIRYPLPDVFQDPTRRPLYRLVGIRWNYSVTKPGRFSTSDVWAADFPDLFSFAAAVEATLEWNAATGMATEDCVVFGEDE